MLSLFRMERYHLHHFKPYFVTLIVMAITSLISTLSSANQTSDALNICVEFNNTMTVPILLIYWAVTVSIYIASEYKNGFIKSIGGQIEKRSLFAFSKLFAVVIYTLEMFLVAFVFSAIGSIVFSGFNFTFGFDVSMIPIWIVQVLIFIGFSSIIILLGLLSRSSPLGISFGILAGSGLTGILYQLVSYIVNKVGIAEGFNLGQYMIEQNLEIMRVGVSESNILKALIIAVIYIIIMTIGSAYVLRKRDI